MVHGDGQHHSGHIRQHHLPCTTPEGRSHRGIRGFQERVRAMGRFYHGPVGYHLKNCSVYKLIIMIDALEEVNYRLRVQVRHQPTITAALI